MEEITVQGGIICHSSPPHTPATIRDGRIFLTIIKLFKMLKKWTFRQIHYKKN